MEIYQTEMYRGYTINICYDEYCENPREINDGYLSHMICWHRRHNLGDKHSYGDEHEFLESLARQYVPYETVEKFLLERRGDCWLEKTTDGYILHDCAKRYYDAEYDSDTDIDIIIDNSWDYMSDKDFYTLISEADSLVISTIACLDHSGISVWIGGKTDPWDSGICGYIYQTKKDTIEQNGATEANWKEVAWKNMKAEMREYNQFVQGEVFYWTIDSEDGFSDGVSGYIGTDSIEYMLSEARNSIDGHIKELEEERAELLNFVIANFDSIPENSMFTDGSVIYRADRQNLFSLLQLSSAPIKDNTVGVFITADLSSVPTETLKAMRDII